jgi:hypothetical protein
MALGRCSHCGSIFHDSEDCDIRIKDRMLEAENTRLKGELAEAIAILREGQSDLWACRDRHNEGPAYPLPWVGKAEKFLTRTQSIPVAEPLQCGKPDPITCVCDDTDCVCDFAAEPPQVDLAEGYVANASMANEFDPAPITGGELDGKRNCFQGR